MSEFFKAKFHPYVLTVCIRVSSSFSFFENSFMSSIYIRWLISFFFFFFFFSDIMAIINSRVTVHLLGKSLFGSLFQPSFFLLLLIQLYSFEWVFFDEVYDFV